MTIQRAALYAGVASLFAAWLSSAASLSVQHRDSSAAGVPVDGPDDLAATVQAQGMRLKERLASAAPPRRPMRNPFEFHRVQPQRPPHPVREGHETPPSAPVIEPPAEPVLALIGVAERRTPDGLVRTGMIATDRDELIMVEQGDLLLQRYTVAGITADEVELADADSGGARRLRLQGH